jgi:hypothetical protein
VAIASRRLVKNPGLAGRSQHEGLALHGSDGSRQSVHQAQSAGALLANALEK